MAKQSFNPENKPLARPKKNNNPIRVALSIAICLGIVLAIVCYSHSQMKVVTSFAEHTVSQLGDSAAAEIESTYGYAVNSIKAVAAAVSQNMTSPELEDPSAAVLPLTTTTPFGSIEYIRPDGMNVMNIGQPFDASEREYYINGIKGISGVWNNYHPKIAEETLMNFYTPLIYDGSIAGVLTGYIRATTQVSPLLESEFFGEDTQGLLYDRQGMVICSSVEMEFEKDLTVEKFFGKSDMDQSGRDALLSLLNEGADGVYSYNDNDGEGRVYIKGIDGTDWVIAIFIPAQSFNAVMAKNLSSTYFVVGVIILLAAAYIIFIIVLNRKESLRYARENAQLELENRQFNEQNAKAFRDLSDLNAKLEENQALLEESAAEQESQLEEISHLNAELETAVRTAQAANNAKSTFLFNMSHDIRTPMNAILGFTELMKKEVNNPQKIEDYRAKIEDSGHYLLSIINNVLDMARVESGQVVLDEDIMDVGDDNSPILEVLRSDIEKKHLKFTHQMEVQHRYAIADRLRMKQILLNLLSNAVKYTPDGGRIHLETEEVPCSKEGYATYVISVSDTGIGMSKEFREHIFDSFSRERNTTYSKVIGTGLGMAIVKKLVDLMGGSIEVESEPGKGSKFTVTLTLKIAEKPEANTENAEDAVSSLEGKRILLAEDNDLNAEIAIAILEEHEIQVERAEDGVQCIDMLNKAEAGYYDLILMDIQMPNLDGYHATEKIRLLTDTAKANIPILAMTANAFAEDKEKAFSVGMNGHIAKPINVTELMKALAGILG